MKFNIACFFSYAPSLSNGVGILVFNRQILNESFCIFDPAGRYLSFDFYFQNVKYRIVNVYAPAVPSQSSAFFRNLEPLLLCTHSCILAGDFNCVIDSYTDVRGPGQGRPTWNARELRRLIAAYGLTDSWTSQHASNFVSTWRRGLSQSRLDRL